MSTHCVTHRISFNPQLWQRRRFPHNYGKHPDHRLFLSARHKSQDSKNSNLRRSTAIKNRKNKKKEAYTPISKIITSKKFQDNVSMQFTEFTKKFQSIVTPKDFKNRPSWEGVEMDAAWWRYNMFLACIPSIIIVIVCESNQKEMEKYVKEKSLLDQKRIYGEDYVAKVESELDRTGDTTLWSVPNKLYNNIKIIFGFATEEEILVADNHLLQDNDEISHEVPNSTIPRKSVIMGEEEGREQEQFSELIRRIQMLEEKVGVKNESLQDIGLEKKKKYNVKRLQQSGIQNRIDDRLMGQWEEDERLRKRERDDEESSTVLSLREKIKSKIKQKGSEFIENVVLVAGYNRDTKDDVSEESNNDGVGSSGTALKLKESDDKMSAYSHADFVENVSQDVNDGSKELLKTTPGSTRYSWISNLLKRRTEVDAPAPNQGVKQTNKFERTNK